MRFRRRRLPPELLDALRAAERPPVQRWRTPLRRVPMAGWFLLAALALVASVEIGLPWRDFVPGGSGPALPRVVYGIPDGTPAPAAPRFTARVSAIDGDTLVMAGERLRIEGIDAPEMRQACRRRGADYACGVESHRAMAAILGRAMVSCQALGTDVYGRRLVRCHNEAGADIGAELVRQGWALAFTRYSMAYVGQEAEARAARRGLWEGSFDAPWDWRARHRP